jgi:hypothetical protein
VARLVGLGVETRWLKETLRSGGNTGKAALGDSLGNAWLDMCVGSACAL